MKTLEVIHVRLAARNPEVLAASVWDAIGGDATDADVRVYRHVQVETDLLVQIRRESPDASSQPSDLGLRVAALLRGHGAIEHAVWLEQPASAGARPGRP